MFLDALSLLQLFPNERLNWGPRGTVRSWTTSFRNAYTFHAQR